jgi:hypothetical protein
MRNRNFHRRDGMEWFFDRVFPKLFIGMFVVVLTAITVQFAVMGWVGYQVISDPEGAAEMIGTIVGEAVRPVADAIKGE